MSVAYTLDNARAVQIGLVALQADETIERDMRALLPDDVEYMVSRVPSGTTVTPDTLREMAHNLTAAAALFPRGANMACVGYGCTSGAAEIGSDRIAQLVQAGIPTGHVTDPVTSLIAACRTLNIKRLGLLSPYIESVSDKLRMVLRAAGIDVAAFASFDEPVEERVVRISIDSIVHAARDLGTYADVDALFLSCTNLRTLEAIPQIEDLRNIPVLSSNLVLAWHMAELAGIRLRTNLTFELARVALKT